MPEKRTSPPDQERIDQVLKTRTLSDAEILKAGGEYKGGQMHIPPAEIERFRKEMDNVYESAETKARLDLLFQKMDTDLPEFERNLKALDSRGERLMHKRTMGAFERLNQILEWSDEMRSHLTKEGYCCWSDTLRPLMKIKDKPTSDKEYGNLNEEADNLFGHVEEFTDPSSSIDWQNCSPLLLAELKVLLDAWSKQITLVTIKGNSDQPDQPSGALLNFAKKIAVGLGLPEAEVMLDFRRRIVEPAKEARRKIDQTEK